MMAGEFAKGSALLIPREVPRHDVRTAQALARLRRELSDGTDAKVLAAAGMVERLPADNPLTPEVRGIVDAELAERHLSLAVLAGGAL